MRKSRLEARTVAALDKGKGRAGLNSNESLAEVQRALRTAQAEAKRERQARIQAEKALTTVRKELAVARLGTEPEPQAQIKRVSFVIRLTLDEHGQFGRTEIEHVSSGRKQNFLSLDGERLVAFMKACISPEFVPGDAIPTKSLQNN